MPRALSNSKLNAQKFSPEEASERAEARAALIAKALAETDGSNAATAEKDAAKRLMAGDAVKDLREPK